MLQNAIQNGFLKEIGTSPSYHEGFIETRIVSVIKVGNMSETPEWVNAVLHWDPIDGQLEQSLR